MCAVSNVGDNYQNQWQRQPWFNPQVQPGQGGIGPGTGGGGGLSGPFTLSPPPTREEFDQLKKEVLEMKQLLIKAKAEDVATGQKDCEMEEKLKVLRAVADLVGVDLNDVIPKKD